MPWGRLGEGEGEGSNGGGRVVGLLRPMEGWYTGYLR